MRAAATSQDLERGPFLVVQNGAASGSSYSARDGLTIGRHPLNDICLRDAGIAAHQAVLRQSDGSWVLEDLSGGGFGANEGHAQCLRLELGQPVSLGPVQLAWLSAPPSEDPIQSSTHTQTVTAVPLERAAQGPGFERPTNLQPTSLESVLALETTVAEEQDFGRLCDHLAEWTATAVPAHYCSVLIREGPGKMRTEASRLQSGIGPTEVSCSVVKRAVADRIGVLILDAPEDERVRHGQSIMAQNIRSALCVPLVAHGEVIGALYAATQGVRAAFNESHLRMLSLVAGPVAGALKSARLVQQLSATNQDLLRRLAICARFNDDDTGYHIQRVGDYSAVLAEALGQSPSYCALLRAAAPMHDIGKIGIPQSILQKPGKLTKEEFEHMKRHAEIGAQILGGSSAPLIQLAAEVAGAHHEKWDGSGYPKGLAGDAIPLSGRIVAVADVFDALTSKRCYKPAFSLDKARSILKEGAGQHFDPQIIEVFFKIWPRLQAIRSHYQALERHEAESEAT